MIKYRYGINETGQIVDINTISLNTPKQNFVCVECGEKLVPKIGRQKRAKHFAHKKQTKCNVETYLHRLGKLLFFENYSNSLMNETPFLLKFSVDQVCNFFHTSTNHSCIHGSEKISFNLIDKFKKIYLEKRYNGLIPDLRLFDHKTNTSILIEIAVTHKVDDFKKDSGDRIVEFRIENEMDLELLKVPSIELDCESIAHYNFNFKPNDSVNCKGECKVKHNVFLHYKEGHSIIQKISLHKLQKIIQIGSLKYFSVTPSHYINRSPSAYRHEIKMANLKGYNIKHCQICRHCKINQCTKLNKKIRSDTALRCKHYSEIKGIKH